MSSLRASLFLGLLCCLQHQASWSAMASRSPAARSTDPLGYRFFCGRPRESQMCLPMLRSGCRLQFVPGKSLPPELEDRLILHSPQGARVVRGPADLVGCVEILSPSAALEYCRFFSSWITEHLFEDEQIEAFEFAGGVRLSTEIPKAIWQKLNLPRANSVRVNNAFQVSRVVLRPGLEPFSVRLVVRTERVMPSGMVELVEERERDATVEDLLGVGFPVFL